MKRIRDISAITGPAGHDYTQLAALFRQFSSERIVFVPNPGNAGDALINLGMFKFLSDLGVDWEMGSFDGTYRDRVVMFSGGGALVDSYPEADNFFLRNHMVCKALILLPHTVRAYEELISGMDDRCHLFAREQPSYDFLLKHASKAKVYLCHDMAFYLSDEYISGGSWDGTFLRQPGIGMSWLKMFIKIAIISRLRSSTLNVIRDDVEATNVSVSGANWDLSLLFSTGHLQAIGMHMTPGVCETTAKTLRMILKNYDRIVTNRLHVAILSAIIGSKALMMDNSYGKNRDIFNHSISKFFRNVQFDDRQVN